jgi:hypothetical protein
MQFLRNLLRSVAVIVLMETMVRAQSLDPKHPAPLQPGVNASNIDAFMTPHYWTFIAEKGDVKIDVTFRAQSILGAQLRTTVGFNIYDIKTPDKKFTKLVTSSGEGATQSIEGPSEAEHQMVIEVAPPKALVRAGGDYQIQAVKGIKFLGASPASSDTPGSDPILSRHFRTFGCNNDAECGIRFLPGGVVALSGGERGTWRLFDRERRVYVIVTGNNRQSLKLKPGVGLVKAQDDQLVVYQEVR